MKSLHEPGQLDSVAAEERKAKKGKKAAAQETALESDTRLQKTGKHRGNMLPHSCQARKIPEGTGGDHLAFSRSQGIEHFRCIRLKQNDKMKASTLHRASSL